MHHGLFVPNFGPFGETDAVADLAVAAEDAGWDGIFLWDHVLVADLDTPVADPWITLAVVAARTSRIRLGALITPLPRRRPWKVARETVTLDRLSGGRLVFGAGLGFDAALEFATFDEETDARTRADMLDESLAILDGLWSGETFSHEGDHFRVTETRFTPAPVQQPRIPVWVAGWWPNKRPFRRAARWDGVAPELVGGATPAPEDVAEIAAFVRAERGTDEPFDIAINGWTGDDAAADRAMLARYERAGTTWWLERVGPDRRFSVAEAHERVAAGPVRP